MHKLPDTINFHFTSRCNAGCKFCFSKYNNLESNCSRETVESIISLIAMESNCSLPRRINFVGGEPTIDGRLFDFCLYAKNKGLTTSVVTNGFVMLRNGFDPYAEVIDKVGISIDSVIRETIFRSGRYCKKDAYIPSQKDWLQLAGQIHGNGIPLKINTVIHSLNHKEDMADFISAMSPSQWKLFQVAKIKGQNESLYNTWKIDSTEFDSYVQRQLAELDPDGTVMLSPEYASQMINSYAMIGPNGCFIDNSDGNYSYSQPITEVGLQEAWKQVQFCKTTWTSRRNSNFSLGIREAANG